MFLGTIIILFGLSIILKSVFGIHLPIFRAAFALFLIYLGVNMLMGTWGVGVTKVKSETQAIFSSSKFEAPSAHAKHTHYQTVFGSGELDLTTIGLDAPETDLELHTVFGETIVYLKKGSPYEVEANVAFGKVSVPSREMSALGTLRYASPEFATATKGKLRLHTHCVFGSIEIRER